jgi:glycosyltransferase involved in cell wall biosynthesis
MTQGVSLATWNGVGILDRELALYRALAPRVGGVAIATYGGEAERGYVDADDGIEILPKRLPLPARAYAHVLPLAHRRAFASAAAFKTNQVMGGFAAMRAARLYRKPLIARCGFLWSEFAEEHDGVGSLRARAVGLREGRLFRAADMVVVTTERQQDSVLRRHRLDPERIRVVPNYVDTHAFAPPADAEREPGSLLFVGRLGEQKNLSALLDALAGVDGVSLTLVGEGPLEGALKQQARELGVDARFLGRMPHERLPELMARAEAFAMPSHYEGHPKALIEAMACGLPVLGADVPGVHDVVEDGRTGVLAAGTGAADIRSALERLLAADREAMGRSAREAAGQYALDRIVELELDVLATVQQGA